MTLYGSINSCAKHNDLGIENNMFNWFYGFLFQRLSKTRYGGGFSKCGVFKTRLPQGSVSSCTLFNVYINDHQLKMITIVRCLLYADSLVIWTESSKKQATQLRNNCLDLALKVLERWCNENNRKVNLDKTVSVTFSLTHLPLLIDLSYRRNVISKRIVLSI
ncbi:reverse transcriptase domain-containing protein [Trichonephila clavipes]|nr:reverse transcriptase domain-containing protein [Trichonephila clavipes]